MTASIGRHARFVTVRRRPGKPAQGLLAVAGRVLPCALGRGGVSARKREGDGATPVARMRPVECFWRADRWRFPGARLRGRAMTPRDGWCDAPADRNYNRHVSIPYPASRESMFRDDGLYDLVIVLDWNLAPRRRGLGSAIFMHMARPGLAPTEGCIALEPAVMRRLLPLIGPRTMIEVLG